LPCLKAKTSNLSKKDLSENESQFVKNKGIFIIRSCDDLSRLVTNVFSLLQIFGWGAELLPLPSFIFPKPFDFQILANQDFSQKFSGFHFSKRKFNDYIHLDKKNIKSGDIFQILRMDGLSNLIYVGSGSRASHVVMAMWQDDRLYILESQGSNRWPKQGVQKNAI